MSEQSVMVTSIGVAYRLCENANPMQIKQIWSEVQRNPVIYGEADEYHNYAVAVSRVDDNYTAFQICEMGLVQYPYNTDLIADSIYYGSMCNQYDTCEARVKTLLERPMSTWTWRAFSFLISYLRDRSNWIEDTELIASGITIALDIAQKYQQYYPNEERSYMAEYETRLLLSKIAKDEANFQLAAEHEEAALNLLKNTINNGKYSAVSCSLKYADVMFEQQAYDEVIQTCKRALEFGEDVSSVRLGYFMYLSAQAKEIQLYQTDDLSNTEKIQEIYGEYTAALAEISSNYRKNIAVRAKILEARSGVTAPQAIIGG